MMLAQKFSFSRKFQEASDMLDRCLEICRPLPPKSALYARLHTERAEALLRLKKYAESLKECALVVYAQEDHIPAWLIRFQAHHGLGEHSAALEQVKDLLHKWPQDHRLRHAYERADFLVRKEKRTDFYVLLEVPSIASEMEIKKAYKRKALVLHPDKLPPGSSPEEQRKAQKRFQQLGEALETLTDDFQRKLYDEGYDCAAIRERVEAAKQAAHNHRGGYSHHGHSH
jgi:tetratricopeptide (TPR) repeat protein